MKILDYLQKIFFIGLVTSISWPHGPYDERFIYARDLSLFFAAAMIMVSGAENIISGNKWTVNRMDIPALLLLLWTAFSLPGGDWPNESVLKGIVYFSFYLSIKNGLNTGRNLPFYFYVWIIGFCILGLLTFGDAMLSATKHFPFAYNFANSGILGNYLALGGALILIFTKERMVETASVMNRLSIMMVVFIYLMALGLTNSRAALVALGVTFFIISYFSAGYIKRIKKIDLAYPILIIITIIPLTILKIDSLKGRALIYQVSVNTIADRPWTGYGTGRFASAYHLHQAAYFQQYANADFAKVADSIRTGYNELLQIGIETGIVGIILSITLVIMFLMHFVPIKKRQNLFLWGFYGAVIATLITALFSYPFMETPISLLFLFAVAIIGHAVKDQKVTGVLSRLPSLVVNVVMMSGILLVSWELAGIFRAKYEWQKTAYRAMNGFFDEKSYDLLYQGALKKHPRFLYNYGLELANAGKAEKSHQILTETMEYTIDEKLLCFQGNNLDALGRYTEAEKAYILASEIVPSRFYPKSALLNHYVKTGENEKAIEKGYEILNMPVKFYSSEVYVIQKDARKIVDSLRMIEKQHLRNGEIKPVLKLFK